MMVAKGEATLVLGVATVPILRVPATAVVILSPKTLLGTLGTLRYQVNAGVGITIRSTNVLDVSEVGFMVTV